jgi:sec-independent protein translocase protein TatC
MGWIDSFVKFREKRVKEVSPNPEKEMSFLDHLEELRWHLVRSIAAIVVFAIALYINLSWILSNVLLAPFKGTFFTHQLMCRLDPSLCFEKIDVTYIAISPYEQFINSLTMSLIGGFVFAFPYVIWEFWRFIRPGLHDHEQRSMRGSVAVMSLLFFIGVAFAFFVIVPFSVQFLAGYKLSPEIENQWRIGDVIGMITQLLIGTGLVFEMPVLMLYLTKMGVVTPEFLRKYRRHAIVILLFIAAIITPPDWISQILTFFPLYLLYEISIGVSGRTLKRQAAREAKEKAEEEAARKKAEAEAAAEAPASTPS